MSDKEIEELKKEIRKTEYKERTLEQKIIEKEIDLREW